MFINWILENNIDFHKIIFSNGFKKQDTPTKITITSLPQFFQVEILNTQAFHHNFTDKKDMVSFINPYVSLYKQCNILTDTSQIQLLQNKRGELRITEEKAHHIRPMSHDRPKEYLITAGVFRPWLFHLGVMDIDGNIIKKRYHKFRQFNRFLEFIEDIADEIPDNSLIVDFGCGKSYLTFAIYDYLNHQLNKNVRILAFDLKEEVIKDCQALANELDYNIQFKAMDIENFDSTEPIAMMFSLHACDTATDFALYHSIRLQANIIMSVPCCQKEIRQQINSPSMELIVEQGILKEQFSSLLTDAIRVALLNDFGYDAQIVEFIDLEHTAKNLLIRGVRNSNKPMGISDKTKMLIDSFALAPTLEKLLMNIDNHEQGRK